MATTEASPTLCRCGCGLAIDPLTYSGAEGWSSEVCRLLSEFSAERATLMKESRALRSDLLSMDLAACLLGIQKVRP